MQKTFYAIALGLGLLGACSMQQDITVALPEHESVPFIECYLEPGMPARAIATQSVGFFDKAEVEPANDLRFVLKRGAEEIYLHNEYVADSAFQDFFNYTSSDTIGYVPEGSWELVVSKENIELARGKASFLPKPQIKNIHMSLEADTLLHVSVELWDNPEQENYYRLHVYTKHLAPGSGFSGLWDDKAASGGVLTLTTGPTIKVFDAMVIVSLYHIDKEYYTFLRSVQKASDANYNPFAQPANIESNLEGEAMGVFTAISGVTDTLYLQHLP